MIIPESLLPSDLLFVAHFTWFAVLVQAIRQVSWRAFIANRSQNVFLGSTVGLLLLWSFNVGVTPGLGFHFLGVTVFIGLRPQWLVTFDDDAYLKR